VYEDKPCAKYVDNVVEEISVGGAVDGGIDGEDVEENTRDISEPIFLVSAQMAMATVEGWWCRIPSIDRWEHPACAESFHE
jgi:hypothetical protein